MINYPLTRSLFQILVILSLSCTHTFAQKPGSQIAEAEGPQFTFVTKRGYDFGSVVRNSTASYQFQFKNTGNKPLVITNMHASDKDKNEPSFVTSIEYPKSPVKPNRYGYITVTITAKDETGSFRRELYVTSNATPDNYLLLLVAGAVTTKHEEFKKEINMEGYFELLVPVIQAMK